MGEREVPDESMYLGAAIVIFRIQRCSRDDVLSLTWFLFFVPRVPNEIGFENSSIADQEVADKFYEDLSGASSGETSHGISIEDSSRVLHHAVQALRLEGVPLPRWVPFTHLGK